MYRKLLLLGAAALALDLSIAGAQTAPVARPIFSSDSIEVGVWSPTISPDEKWLVFVRQISNQETRVMIRPFAGGEPRELVTGKGVFSSPRFTPRGDRIVMASDVPRRDPGDNRDYLVSAPFDSRTGTLSGPVRQITLDGVNSLSFTISPDGQWVAYVESPSRALKLVPIAGGNARTLADKEGYLSQLTWTPDGRSVLYETREGDQFNRKRVSRDGGPPAVVVRSKESLGYLTPDNRYSVVLESGLPTRPRILHVFAADGHELGEATIPTRIWIRSGFAVNGKYLLGTRSDAVAPIKVVPVAGGPIQQLTKGDVYDWAGSWTPKSEALYVWTEEKGNAALALVTRDGRLESTVPFPDKTVVRTMGEQDGYEVYLEGRNNEMNGWRVMALNLKDGSRKELAHGVRRDNAVVGPGGMYYGLYNGEAYYQQLVAGRLEVRASNVRGVSRLIGELPADRENQAEVSVFQTRIVYSERFKDSVRLQLIAGPGRQPTTLGTFPKSAPPGEVVWSYDGRQLAAYLRGARQTQLVYRFDAAGAVQGAPLSFTLPFAYYYEVFWLPDGSGLTMIAQPRDAANTEVALVKLADPAHPILLTKDDPGSKWGHSVSPDGKYVAYASAQLRGSSIYLIDVAELIKQAQAQK
jgi:lipoprotein LpqB-like beta-propeller protein/WD40 repeat protein